MDIDQANEMKSFLRSYRPRLDNDFNLPKEYYIRIKKADREFLVKGGRFSMFVNEVGLGENGIGYRKVFEGHTPTDVQKFLKNLKKPVDK